MTIRRATEALCSGIAVYVVVACAASADFDNIIGGGGSSMSINTGGAPEQEPGGGGGMSTGAMSAGGIGDGAGGMDEASAGGANDEGAGGMSILDPVPDANAAEDGTRIVNLYRTTADGLKTPAGFYDTQLGLKCNFLTAGDGKERCLPTWNASVGLFSDPGCTSPVAQITKDSCAPTLAYSAVSNASCTAPATVVRIYSVGGLLSTPLIYSGTPDSCTELSDSVFETYDFYSATEIPPETYAEGILVQGG